jgi:CHAT domain-containing protein
LAVLLLGLAAPLGAESHASPDPFAGCESRLHEAPERWESARCFYEVALREKLWDQAARRLETLGTRHPERPWLRLAAAYVEEERDAGRATERYRDAVAAFESRGHIEGEVRARSVFAVWLSRLGERREAGAQLDAAVRRAEAAGDPALLAEALIFQARYLRRLETDLERPYRLARRAESQLFPRGPALQQILCLELLARLSQDLGLPERAADYYRRLEPLAKAHGRSDLEAEAQFGLGLLLFHELDRTYRTSGRARAAAQMREALATAVAVGIPVLQAKAHSVLAYLADPSEAESHAGRCLALAQGRNDALSSFCLLALARQRAGTDPAGAERYLEEARNAAARSGDLQSLARFWYDRMNFSWRFGPKERAVADSMEAIRAVEALRDRQLEQAGRAGLFSRWLAPYYVASGHLFGAFLRSGDPADLDRAFAITESMRARVLRDLLAAPRSPGSPVSRAAVEAALAPGEALLSFQIAPRQDFFGFAGGSWLLVSTRRGSRVYRLPESVDRAPLETAVSGLLGLIEGRDGSEADLAAALYEPLLGRALADLPKEVDRLVIMPDGVLHLLPFPLLRSRRDGFLLADRYQVSVAPSATLWWRWHRQVPREARPALVLADPDRPERRERLPWARREGRYVARRCGTGSLLRTGREAGEAFLKRQDLSGFGVLHLAAHAVADEASPETSSVLLAADAPGEDGRLQVDEIARLDLNGGLVALSSCRGAAGALVGGEGVMSLTRGFFAAGAAAVVGSLWPVRDDDAEAFFAAFYDRLAAGDTAAAAFSAAQRESIREDRPAQAWAGFVLSGNGDWRLPPSPRRDGPESRLFLAGTALLALFAGYVLIRRRTAVKAGSSGCSGRG